MKELIVIIEDEVDILEILEYNLKKEGFDVEGFLNTSRVEDILKTENVDLIIVDRNLPQVDGADFVRALRKRGFQIPVMFLTAKVEDGHKIEGFEAGGDDYITKPFNIQELILRIKALLKRTSPNKKLLQHRDIIMMLDSQKCYIDDKEITLTKLEFSLLCEFIKNKNIVLSREILLGSVWSEDDVYQDRTVDVAIKRLKEKIDSDKQKNYIQSIRGVGYKFC